MKQITIIGTDTRLFSLELVENAVCWLVINVIEDCQPDTRKAVDFQKDIQKDFAFNGEVSVVNETNEILKIHQSRGCVKVLDSLAYHAWDNRSPQNACVCMCVWSKSKEFNGDNQ